MNFQLDNNTILLIVVAAFLAYYFFSDYKEGFKPQRGISKSQRGLSKKGQQMMVTPAVVPPSVQIPEVQPVVVVPQKPVQVGEDVDFAGLL